MARGFLVLLAASITAGAIAAVACDKSGSLVVFDPARHCDRMTTCAAKLAQLRGNEYATQAADRDECVAHSSAVKGQGAAILSAYFTDCSPADDDCQYSICMLQHTTAATRAKNILFGRPEGDGE